MVTCEKPELRDQQPMVLTSLGEDWNSQTALGVEVDDGFWLGGEGVSVEDFNGDNLLDIFVPTHDRNHLFIQQSDGTFEDLFDMYFESCDPNVDDWF